MSDLRKAAEMALAKLDHLWEIAVDERMGTDVLPEIKALRQALAQPEQKREWVGYTSEDRKRIVPMLAQSLINHDEKTMAKLLEAILIDIEQQLKEKNT